MKTRQYQTQIAVALCLLTFAAPCAFAAPGGPLIPPGPPAVIYKTLDEVEPRTPISSLPYTINKPGSYYATTNLVGSALQNGITITASDVTLDLRGFALIGVPTSVDGVNVPLNLTNITIINGTAVGWGQMGFDADTAYNSQLIELRASRNGTYGLRLGAGGIIRNCSARTNGLDGIGSLVGTSSSIIGCVSVANGDDGIEVGNGSSVSGCTVSGNADDGIVAGDGSIITGNASSGNRGDGIQVANDVQVANNDCNGNGAGAAIGAGILATGNDNSILANNLTDADRGLDIQGTGNVIANNTVRRNTANYNIVAGNQLNLLLGQIPQIISWPCNVLLSGALTGTAANNGITIAADDVTIDLGGHALVGVSGSLDGVSVSGSRTNITVRNGSIRAWGSDGVQASTAYNSQFTDLKVASCGANGIQAGLGSSVKGCSARSNGADGITTSSGCNISDCTAARNKSDGIVANAGSAVTGCNAFDNVSAGIYAADGSTVLNSTAYSNTNGIVANSGSTVTSCTASINATNGIVTDFGATVTGCTCRDNRTGINVGDDSRIVGNTCDNGVNGILVRGSDNRIDGNHVTDASTGINVTTTGNLIIRNTAAGNTTAYSIVAGNNYGAILASPGAAFAATNPWNNFSY
jgi:hypothetical protein